MTDHGVALAFSPDDKYVAVAFHRSKDIKVYEQVYERKQAKEGARVSFPSGHSRDIIALEWAPGGRVSFPSGHSRDIIALEWAPGGRSAAHSLALPEEHGLAIQYI
ncbi:hypothetical protein T484DRAFT_1867031 [Baffinella frigidus]|nr:hypothetical protein T484DRAFT_1867031 [Cryptophyta sp. CCMP2293]